jgi:hypothetical protein
MNFSLNKRKFNPHPFIPSPNPSVMLRTSFGGGEESEKQGIALAYSLGSPCFSVKIHLNDLRENTAQMGSLNG